MLAEMLVITSRGVMATLFSDTLPAPVLRQAHHDLATIVAVAYRRMLTPPPLDRLPIPDNRRYHHARARLRRTIAAVVADRRADSGDSGDLLSALLAARDPDDGHGMTDTEIRDQVVTFFVAGTETTATTLAWALHQLGGRPDIERRLHAEVDAALPGNRPAVHADLPHLELTRRVIMETLRLWPPGWLLTRTVTTDTSLQGCPIPAGTNVIYSPYLIHRRPDLHPDPDRFDPDRWLPQQATAIPRDTFIPFGGGARKCIGDTFATTEATLALATITARWRLEPLSGQRVRPALAAALRPRGLRMRAMTRTPAGTVRRSV